MQLSSDGRCHSKRLHQQAVVVALIVENFMRIVGAHYQTKIKELPGNFQGLSLHEIAHQVTDQFARGFVFPAIFQACCAFADMQVGGFPAGGE